jgi:hypothetical protein
MGTTPVHTPRVVLPFKKSNLPKVSAGAKLIQSKITVNASMFGALSVTMAALLILITAFDTANQNTKTTKAASGARKVALDNLWSALKSLMANVQTAVDQSPGEAASFAQAAGMALGKDPDHVKEILAAALTTVSGVVHLVANRTLLVPPSGRKSSHRTFLWRQLIAGVYTNLDSTPVANTTVTGLPMNTEVGFEVAVKDAKGVSAWSQTVTIQVHPV